MRIYIVLILIVVLVGCYGVNEKASHIGPSLHTECLDEGAWDSIQNSYSTEKIEDSVFFQIVPQFDEKHFPSHLLFFQDSPKEIVAVSEGYSSVRYVYNPNISSRILDGLSPQLDEEEKFRIRNRVQRLLLDFQCAEGREKSLKYIKETENR